MSITRPAFTTANEIKAQIDLRSKLAGHYCAATQPYRNSMSVTMAATATTATAFTGRRAVAAGAGGGEHGKFLGQFL